MVLPDSHRMFVSCATRDSARGVLAFGYRSFTFSGRAFQHFPLAAITHFIQSHNPYRNHFLRFGLFQVRSPLLPESLICFLFLKVLRCFNSLRSLQHTYLFSMWSPYGGVPPFGHHRVKAFWAARRCFSQPNTSFVASRYLGILRTPLITSSKTSFALSSLLTLSKHSHA